METFQLSLFQKVLKIFLGINLIFAGLSHLLWARQEFIAQVPLWLPMDGDLVVVLSGMVEIALGMLLIIMKKHIRNLGIVVAVFFVVIFPGNISQYVNGIDAFGLETDRARFIRLLFQPVLVLWALWSCGFWRLTNFSNKSNVK